MGNMAGIPEASARCARCSASLCTLCERAEPAAHTELIRISGRRFVDAGGTILASGGEASLVGTVLAGILKVSKTLLNGREQIVSLVYPGEFFGQLFRPTMDFAVEAATDVELCVADREAYESVVRRHPALKQAVLQSMVNDLAIARESLLLLGCLTTLERVATYLLIMLERRENLLTDMAMRSQKRVAATHIRRSDLASYLSTTFETISRHLHHLAAKGVIRIIDSNHFEVLDPDRLRTIAGVSQADLAIFNPSSQRTRPPLSAVSATTSLRFSQDEDATLIG